MESLDWFAFAALGGVGGFVFWAARSLEALWERVEARQRR